MPRRGGAADSSQPGMTTSTSGVSTSTQALIDAANGAAAKTKSTTADAQDRFLKLLTTQLKNQDPLNPMDNAQMTSQLAQISTVDGIEKLNATLQKLLSSSVDGEAMQAAVRRVVQQRDVRPAPDHEGAQHRPGR